MSIVRACACLLLLALSPSLIAETIHHNLATEPKEAYALEVLQLALAYSGQDQFQASNTFLSEGRMVEELKAGTLSVMWAGTSATYEQDLRPIRIPLYKGLLGHRLMIIRAGDQARFSRVNTLDDLKQLKAGQGTFWADTAILRNAGIPVVTSVKYPGLFHMLDGGRFDYFPRGAHEPWSELPAHPDLPLAVEQDLMILYPLPMYLFTAKNNEALARRIEDGLEKAIADGSFDRHFFANPMIQDVLNRANLKSRRVFRIANPNLTPQTPLDRPELWLDLSRL